MTPIDRATRQLVVGLLSGHPHRKLPVVLMDGMSWANAVQLLARLEQERWSPRPQSGRSDSGAALPEVVAPAVLIAPEWLAQIQGEDGAELETRPFPKPDWWDLEAPVAATPAAVKGKLKAPPAQTVVPGALAAGASGARGIETRGGRRHARPPLVAALRGSKIFKNHIQDQRQPLGPGVRQALPDPSASRRRRGRPHGNAELRRLRDGRARTEPAAAP